MPHTDTAYSILDFLRRAENLKSTTRTTWTRSGRRESSAEHSWRLCLFAMLISRHYPELDALKVLQLSIVHDLGEAISGDIPAPEQTTVKTDQERHDIIDIVRPLDLKDQHMVLALWEEYEGATSPEARLVKALDKLETILQQAQGATPDSFDYAFNLHYGTRYTQLDDLIAEIRTAIDEETQNCLLARNGING